MGRIVYRTVRCPKGCEHWLHPRMLDRHLAEFCSGHPWTEEAMDSAVVPERHTKAIVDLLDPSLVHRIPQLGPSQIDPLDGRCRRAPNPVRGDVCIESPIWGIDARRWLSVTLAAVYKHGPRTFLRAADPKQFRLLESEVASNGKYVNCPTCGGFMTSRGLEAHQANSSLCRFTRAVNEVEDAWAIGFRDPWNTPGAPTTWETLARRPVWRQGVRTIAFPHFIAVLLSPDQPPQQEESP